MQFGLGDHSFIPSPLLALCKASTAAEAALHHALEQNGNDPSEPWVARHICSVLDNSDAEDEVLFASNSLPIRHLDMFCPSTPLTIS